MPTYPSVLEESYVNAPHFTFAPTTAPTSRYSVVNNPRTYDAAPASQSELVMAANLGSNLLNGGFEYAPTAIPMEWEMMDWSEYKLLAQYFHMQPTIMTDQLDNGYEGWLRLGKFGHIAGIGMKKGAVQAVFLASRPSPGVSSTVTQLGTPAAPTISEVAGGNYLIGAVARYAYTLRTIWGESLPRTFNHTFAANSKGLQISWSAPGTKWYRSARLYADINPGSPGTQYAILGDVLSTQTQQWTDYSGFSLLVNTVNPPTRDTSYCGQFLGGLWIDGG